MQQNTILRDSEKNLVEKGLETLTEITEKKDDYEEPSEQLIKDLKLGTHTDSTRVKTNLS